MLYGLETCGRSRRSPQEWVPPSGQHQRHPKKPTGARSYPSPRSDSIGQYEYLTLPAARLGH
eukprot:10100477-Prorocentrum_lima.AAC.1